MANEKTIVHLREALFDTLEKVRADTISNDKAKQICDIAQVIINSANAETQFLKALNGSDQKEGSGFIPVEDKKE
jgi:hypothetical protein